MTGRRIPRRSVIRACSLVVVLFTLSPIPANSRERLPYEGEARVWAGRSFRDFQATLPKTGEIESRCLYSWSDSHNFHSAKVVVTDRKQVTKTTWKRLDYCIRLKVTGPIDVKGIAKSYIDKCVDYGLKKNSTRHALEALIGLGVDILSAGSTGFAATTIALVDYTNSVANNTVECLSDSAKIEDHLRDSLKDHFKSTVNKESNWVYWDL